MGHFERIISTRTKRVLIFALTLNVGGFKLYSNETCDGVS